MWFQFLNKCRSTLGTYFLHTREKTISCIKGVVVYLQYSGSFRESKKNSQILLRNSFYKWQEGQLQHRWAVTFFFSDFYFQLQSSTSVTHPSTSRLKIVHSWDSLLYQIYLPFGIEIFTKCHFWFPEELYPYFLRFCFDISYTEHNLWNPKA